LSNCARCGKQFDKNEKQFDSEIVYKTKLNYEFSLNDKMPNNPYREKHLCQSCYVEEYEKLPLTRQQNKIIAHRRQFKTGWGITIAGFFIGFSVFSTVESFYEMWKYGYILNGFSLFVIFIFGICVFSVYAVMWHYKKKKQKQSEQIKLTTNQKVGTALTATITVGTLTLMPNGTPIVYAAVIWVVAVFVLMVVLLLRKR
jgi:predicted membrane channel-forming protein YqfA (hemolysin III family)